MQIGIASFSAIILYRSDSALLPSYGKLLRQYVTSGLARCKLSLCPIRMGFLLAAESNELEQAVIYCFQNSYFLICFWSFRKGRYRCKMIMKIIQMHPTIQVDTACNSQKDPGCPGPKGDVGYPGPQGHVGPQGLEGLAGDTGPTRQN